MRCLIVYAQAMFITDKYRGWKNGGSSKEVRFKDLSRKIHTEKKKSADIVCKLSIADFQKIGITDCLSCFWESDVQLWIIHPRKENGTNKFVIPKILLEYFDWW